MTEYGNGKHFPPCWRIGCPGCDYSIGNGLTNNQVHRIFMLVSKPGDWKAPIKALTSLEDVEKASGLPGITVAEAKRLIETAVAFNTATSATVVVRAGIMFQVRAVGYRMGPAGDH